MSRFLPPPAAANPIPSDVLPAVGTTVTVSRITRSGQPRTWTGTLLDTGTMDSASGPMDYVVVDTDRGREIFALDPFLSTTVEAVVI